MKTQKAIEFRCDKCAKNITGKQHIRIFIGWTSGWMAPPYDGGKPVADLVTRKPEFHFCKPECFTLFFNKKLHEIRPHTRRNAKRNSIQSAVQQVLAEVGSERPHLPGEDNMGTRDDSRGTEGQRSLGDSVPMRVFAFRGRVSGLRDTLEAYQRMDSIESDNGLGVRRSEISPDSMETTTKVPNFAVRAFKAATRAIYSVMP